jgi:hypothetical protein
MGIGKAPVARVGLPGLFLTGASSQPGDFNRSGFALGCVACLVGRIAMQGWQPIATAPRDGRAILVYIPGSVGHAVRQDVIAVYWSGWSGGRWETAWSGAKLMARPTHWMPLPDPPQQPDA